MTARDVLGVPRATLLGIPEGASAADEQRAYRKLAVWLHPDKAPAGLPEGCAAAWFQLLDRIAHGQPERERKGVQDWDGDDEPPRRRSAGQWADSAGWYREDRRYHWRGSYASADDHAKASRTRHAGAVADCVAQMPAAYRRIHTVAELRDWWASGGRAMWVLAIDLYGDSLSLHQATTGRYMSERDGAWTVIDNIGGEANVGPHPRGAGFDWKRTIIGVLDPDKPDTRGRWGTIERPWVGAAYTVQSPGLAPGARKARIPHPDDCHDWPAVGDMIDVAGDALLITRVIDAGNVRASRTESTVEAM